jgi:hypothetical protein
MDLMLNPEGDCLPSTKGYNRLCSEKLVSQMNGRLANQKAVQYKTDNITRPLECDCTNYKVSLCIYFGTSRFVYKSRDVVHISFSLVKA